MYSKSITIVFIALLIAGSFGCRKKTSPVGPQEPVATAQPDIDSINNQAESLRTSGRPDEAIALLQQALKTNPSYAKTHNNLGCALRDKGQLAEATAEFERAIELNPEYILAHNNLGVVLSEQKRFDEALKAFGMALTIAPDNRNTLEYLWQTGLSAGKMDEVLKVLLSIEQAGKANAEIYFRAGTIYSVDKKTEEAVKQFEKTVELKPEYARARGALGDELVRAARYKEAAEQFETAIKLDPNDAEAMASYAVLLAASPEQEMRNLDLAITLAEEACRLTNYSSSGPLDALAKVYFARGQLDLAIETGQKALEAANKAGENEYAVQIKARIEAYTKAKEGK